MPRLALINMVIGFTIIFLSASFGTFIVVEMEEMFRSAPHLLNDWYMTLLQSSHGHSSLLGMIQILFGLTLPYSRLSTTFKGYQTLALIAGSLAMGPILALRATVFTDSELLLVINGLLLALFLFAIIFHAFGIYLRSRC